MEKNYKFFGVSSILFGFMGVLSIIHYSLFYLPRSLGTTINFNRGFYSIWTYLYAVVGSIIGLMFIISAFVLNKNVKNKHFPGFAVVISIGVVLYVFNLWFYPFIDRYIYIIWNTSMELPLYLSGHGAFILSYILMVIGWSLFAKGSKSETSDKKIQGGVVTIQIGNISGLITSAMFMVLWFFYYQLGTGYPIIAITVIILSYVFPSIFLIGYLVLGVSVQKIEFLHTAEPTIGGGYVEYSPSVGTNSKTPEPQYQIPKENRCSNCGSVVRPGNRFCPFCGNSM